MTWTHGFARVCGLVLLANTDPLNAEFGKVTSQANLPRDIQIAVKLVF